MSPERQMSPNGAVGWVFGVGVIAGLIAAWIYISKTANDWRLVVELWQAHLPAGLAVHDAIDDTLIALYEMIATVGFFICAVICL